MKRVIVICNAIDNEIRVQRGISTDSPAASRKMFLMANALQKNGVRAIVVSLGRGRQDSSFRYFRSIVRRMGGITIVYLPFFQVPILSELISFFSPAFALARLRRKKQPTTVVFYNRTTAYLLGLVAARSLGFRAVLDLEDGEVYRRPWSLKRGVSIATRWLFDSLCNGGALLACGALSESTTLRPTLCYYGIVETEVGNVDWSSPCLTILLGGTVSRATGAILLVKVINALRDGIYSWKDQVRFEITGHGDCADFFAELATDMRAPRVIWHGRTSDSEYKTIVRCTNVGLALKPRAGDLAFSTFPSKVIELADVGALVLTTNISDVESILGDGALYLNREEPDVLIEQLQWIVQNRCEAEKIAQLGSSRVRAACSLREAGRMLSNFLFARNV